MTLGLLRDYRVLISLAILRHLQGRLSESATPWLLPAERRLPSIAIDALRGVSFDELSSDIESALLSAGDEQLGRRLLAILHSVESESRPSRLVPSKTARSPIQVPRVQPSDAAPDPLSNGHHLLR